MNADSLPLRYETWWRAGGALLVVSVVVLSLMPHAPEIPINEGDKLGHLLAYGSLMFWFAQIDMHRRARLRWALAFIAMGIALEFAQGMMTYRTFDLIDMAANACGVLLGWLAAPPRVRRVFHGIEKFLD